MMNGFGSSNFTKGYNFPIDNKGRTVALPNPKEFVTDWDSAAKTARQDTLPSGTNNPVRMVYTLPPFSPELQADLHATFVFGFKEAPKNNAVIRNVNALNAMVNKKYNKKVSRSIRSNPQFETNLLMNLSLVNYFLHSRTLDNGKPLRLSEIFQLIQPLGVSVTQNNAKQSAGLNGLPAVLSIMHQGITDTYNIWGNRVPVDADLYFLIIPVLVKKRKTAYSITEEKSTQLFLDPPDNGYIWRITPHYTTNGCAPRPDKYTSILNGELVQGGYWKIGRCNQRLEKCYVFDGDIDTGKFEVSNNAMKFRPLLEIMLDANTSNYY